MTHTEWVHYAEKNLTREVCGQYWHSPTDHDDFGKILQAIDRGGGQACDVPGVLRALHEAGFKVVKR